jgi:hypothetical protein
MHLFFVVTGIVWLALAHVMVFALAYAARHRSPEPDSKADMPRDVLHQEPSVTLFEAAMQGARLFP